MLLEHGLDQGFFYRPNDCEEDFDRLSNLLDKEHTHLSALNYRNFFCL